MAALDDIIAKTPKPILVFVVLVVALSLIIYMKPLKDGCDVEISNFTTNVKGVLINTRIKKKLKMADVNISKDLCKSGNSPGSCENYFAALKKISEAFVTFDTKCIPQLKKDEAFSNLEPQLKDGVKILSLLAWGEQPPAGLAERAGWLTKSELYTFCRLKTVLIEVIGEKDYVAFREGVFKEFPDVWPDKLKQEATAEEVTRPLVFKWTGNPSGTMNQSEILQRSLFSLRCEQYQ
jgi:hypothetical protein